MSILGGTISDNGAIAYDRARVTIRGGSFVDTERELPGRFEILDEAVVRVHGDSFAIDEVPVPFGQVPISRGP